jgi:phage-related protein
VAILLLPDSAKITKRQKCAVKVIDVSSYSLRSSHAPLAEVSVEIDILEQSKIDTLIAQIETARGEGFLELPYLSSGERYLVQEYKSAPLLHGVYSNLSLTMIQQRLGIVPEDDSLFRCPQVPLYESAETNSFRNFAQQFNGGFQATKAKGARSKEQYWDVVFHLSPAEAALLDQQLVARRGIYPFNWSPIGDQLSNETWLCSEWQIEYFVYGLYIFSAKFLRQEFSAVVIPPQQFCDPYWNNVLALLPLKTSVIEVKNGLAITNNTTTVDSTSLDPFGNPGVLNIDHNQGFCLASPSGLPGDYKIELWFIPLGGLNPENTGGDGRRLGMILVDTSSPLAYQNFNLYYKNNGAVEGGINSTTAFYLNPGTVTIGSWNYVKLTRKNNNVKLQINNRIVYTTSSSGDAFAPGSNWSFGRWPGGNAYSFDSGVGKYSNIRVSNIARISPVLDSSFLAYLALKTDLLEINGFSTTGSTGVVINPNKTRKDGTLGAALFGANSRLLLDSSTFDFGSNKDFEISFDIFTQAFNPAFSVLLDTRSNANLAEAFVLFFDNTGLLKIIYADGNVIRITSFTISLNQWHTIRIQRLYNDQLFIIADDVIVYNFTFNNTDMSPGNTWNFGKTTVNQVDGFIGYMSEIQVLGNNKLILEYAIPTEPFGDQAC